MIVYANVQCKNNFASNTFFKSKTNTISPRWGLDLETATQHILALAGGWQYVVRTQQPPRGQLLVREETELIGMKGLFGSRLKSPQKISLKI